MPTTIKLKNSVTTTNAPSSLVQGEVAINITDKKVWVGNAATTPIQLLGAGASGTFGALTCTSLTNSGLTSGRVTYASTGGLLADSANFTFNGTTVTMANDASISGLTVGKGGGAVASNTAVGNTALASNTTGSANTIVGYVAGNGTFNNGTAVGYQALGYFNGNTGTDNTAIGKTTLYANSSGSYNTAVGSTALFSNTTGADNTAIGTAALYPNTTGSQNTAIGSSALRLNTTGSNNTSLGQAALFNNTTASNNTAVGYQAAYSGTTRGNITAIGYQALYSNTTDGDACVAVGYRALYANTTGNYSTAIGYGVLDANTTGTSNSGLGLNALGANTTGSYNTAIGHDALVFNTTASNNTAVGYQAGYSTTTGTNSASFGNQAGYSNTTGYYNTFIGDSAGYFVTTGNRHTIIGRYSGNGGGLDIRTASNYIVLSDGDGNPRVVVNNSGNMWVGCVTNDIADANGVGATFSSAGNAQFSRASGGVVNVNRKTDDGVLVYFQQDATSEGTISVSGTTVSYNGGHLSRWSQLPNNQKDDTLLKGTVMSNLDDMCVWTKDGEELPNEQLNKMKVSDVDGDTNVAGVFVSWDYDEQCQSDDMNVAMTGDMIIRIAEGVVVQKGDLLMSAGDGTAKPQGDDIRRSKTVAKVTSNHVTCTYADGSYCVPCVLMAC